MKLCTVTKPLINFLASLAQALAETYKEVLYQIVLIYSLITYLYSLQSLSPSI